MSSTFIFFLSAAALLVTASGFVLTFIRKKALLTLAAFAGKHPNIHPDEFFDYLASARGALNFRLPSAPRLTIDPLNINFQNARVKEPNAKPEYLSLFSMARGLLCTIRITRLIVLVCKKMDRESAQRVASALITIWSVRICKILRLKVSIEGAEFLPAGGAKIYLFTHASFVDFALAPLILAASRNDDQNKNPAPVFLAAKDHFRDNFILYRLIGLGRAAEVLGMIFVDRHAKDKKREAERVSGEAATLLSTENPPLVIFPQGTRAVGFKGPSGERLNAGYYTTPPRRRIAGDGLHLKKGAAHIALAALKLGIAGGVKLFPVGIKGAALACPRGGMKILSGTNIKLVVEKPIEVKNDNVDDIHREIDLSLKKALSIHAVLERRFFEDARKMFDPMKLEEITLAMKPWRGGDFLFHAILDAIYSCEPKDQRPLLGELAHLMFNFAAREEFLEFKARVAEKVP